MNGLSVVVPAYNEEGSLQQAVEFLLEQLARLPLPSEVIIVNDGSRDGTRAVADTLGRAHPQARVVHHEANRMIGGAIMSGIRNSSFEGIIVSPVDSPLEENQLRSFVAAAENADIVCGYRRVRTGYSGMLSVFSGMYRKMLVFLFCIDLRDFTWISLYRKNIFSSFTPRFPGIAIFPEILVKAHRKGFRIVEINSEMKPRTTGTATVSRPSRVIKLFFETLRLWWHINTQQWQN